MECLLQVVQERDDAVSMLETGLPKSKEKVSHLNYLGLVYHRKPREHCVPPNLNRVHRLLHCQHPSSYMRKHHVLYREVLLKKFRRQKIAEQRYRKRYHDLDSEDVEFGVEQKRLRNKMRL